MDRNPIEQVQRSLGVLRRIAGMLPFDQKVEAALVFINDHCHVTKSDSCFGIPVYSRVELRDFIQKLVAETRSSYYSNKHLSLVQDLLARHEVINPIEKVKLTECDFTKMYRGFTCGSCCSQRTRLSHRHLHCLDCGVVELKSQALVRMVDDYCLFYHKDAFTRQNIYEFVGGVMSINAITAVLKRNFQLKNGFKIKHYKNITRSIE